MKTESLHLLIENPIFVCLVTITPRSSFRLYPEIISDEQRRRYKTEFDSDLIHYKNLCAEMDKLSDQIHQLSRELDCLDEDSIKYQVQESVWLRSGMLRWSVPMRAIACIFLFQGVADEYNRLKDLKRVSGICCSGLSTVGGKMLIKIKIHIQSLTLLNSRNPF